MLQFLIPRIGRTALGIVGLHLASIATSHGATAGIGSAVPDVGDGVQNLGFSTGPADNTTIQYVPSNYLAGDNANALGQAFTTGSNAHGYSLSAISVRQVSWGTTWWDETGGTVTLQAFKLDLDSGNGVWNTTPLALETATVSGEPDGIGLSSGTPGGNARWLTVTLDSPLHLSPNTLYGFQIRSSGTGANDGFFIELDGGNTNPYAGGFALSSDDVSGSLIWDGNNGRPSDRVFVATMTAATEPPIDPPPVAENRAKPFAIERVRLLDSRFKSNQELLRTGYLAWIDPNRLLYPFRENTGLPQAPGATSLGGWEGGGGFTAVRGHMAGHYLTAASKMYAATGDTAFLNKVNDLVTELKNCQDALGVQEAAAGRPYGYLSAFPVSYFEGLETNPPGQGNVPFYTIHKILAGLVDAHVHCGNNLALDMAIAMSDYHRWRVNRLTPAQVEAMFRTDNGNTEEWGGMNEALADIYKLSSERGDANAARHLEFARIFHRDWFITPLAGNIDQLAGLHANTHIPQVVGFAHVASLLDASDSQRARLYQAAGNFWRIVTGQHSFVIGGNSFAEHFHEPGKETGAGGGALDIGTAETCNTYNMLKLSKELFEREPAVEYADFYERALYNDILAALAPDTGMMTYYMSLASGTFKTYCGPEGSCWCCTGTGMENPARYNEAIYFHRNSELWVNLFIPSVLDWQEKGVTVTLATGFPESNQVSISVACPAPTEATLHLRVPSWIAGTPSLTINGLAQAVTAAPGTYLSLTRTWQNGDSMGFTLPMKLHVDRSNDDPSQASILYGPIVLAGDLGTANMPASDQAAANPWQFSYVPRAEAPSLVGRDAGQAEEWIHPTAEPLAFTTAAAFAGGAERKEVTLKPFYEIHHARYSVYWNLIEPENIATWTGNGGSATWSAGANWDAAPANGLGVEFAASAGGTTANDLAVGTRIAGIGFPSQAGAFILAGNGIALEGDVINRSAFSQRIDLPVTMEDGNTWLFDAAASDLVLGGTVSGSGGMMKCGTGDLIVSSDLTVNRDIEVLEGSLRIGEGGTTGSLSAAFVDLAAGTRLVWDRGDDLSLATPIRGEGALVKQGAGTLSLTAKTAHTGPTTVERGTLRLGTREVPALRHRWSFNGDLNDAMGSSPAQMVEVGGNNATLSASAATLAGGTRGASDYLSLGSGLFPKDGMPVTVELWATQDSFQTWARIFDVGASDSENLFMSWSRDSASTDRIEWRNLAVTSRTDESVAPYVAGTEYHILLSIEPGAGLGGTTRVTWYAAPSSAPSLGAAKGGFDTANTLEDLNDAEFWLGRSHYAADHTANASYNEVRIWNRVFDETGRTDLHLLGPDQIGDQAPATLTGSLPAGTNLKLGAAGIFDMNGQQAELQSLEGESGSRIILNGGTMILTATAQDPGVAFAGGFIGNGAIINHGVVRLVGNSPFPAGVNLINHGLLDIMTWQGVLPAGFINEGTVLDHRSFKIDDIQKEPSGVRLRFKTYRGHQYRVQSAADPGAPIWQDAGITLDGGTGESIEQFIPVENGPGRRFWRLSVTH